MFHKDLADIWHFLESGWYLQADHYLLGYQPLVQINYYLNIFKKLLLP